MGGRAFAVLKLFDGVVMAEVDDLFPGDGKLVHTLCQGPAYTASAAGIDKSILRTGVEGVLAFYEFGMENYIPLLAGGPDIG